MTRVAALDVGSSSIRALVFDEHGRAQPGAAHVAYDEFDADKLVAACRSVLGQVGDHDSLAVSCFWHSLVPVDDRDRPLAPVLTWRDLQGSEPPELHGADYHRRTGCFLHPAYWPAKIRRLAAEGVHATRFLSFGDYLLLKLAGETHTSVSIASGTGLFDPNTLDWDAETLDALGIDAARLPAISGEPVLGVRPAIGDGACSNIGAGSVGRGRAAVMIGTSGALRVVYEAASAEPKDGLFLYRVDERRFCEGGALSNGGNLYDWLVRTLRDFDADALARRPAGAQGVTFLPFLGGERSLGWDPARRGTIAGLTFDTTTGDIVQAALEGVCYGFAEIADALAELDSVVVTGGALLANPGWIQILADVLGRTLEVSGVAEGSARGAAVLELERLGLPLPDAPVARFVEPRTDRHEFHLQARAEQRALSESREAS